jgi:hypothetical protein
MRPRLQVKNSPIKLAAPTDPSALGSERPYIDSVFMGLPRPREAPHDDPHNLLEGVCHGSRNTAVDVGRSSPDHSSVGDVFS